MELRILAIVRFAVCLLALVIGLIVMIRADDNAWLRRVTCLLVGLIVYFNHEIGRMLYLVIGSLLEMLIAVMGVGFVLCLGIVIMLFPVIAVIRWLKP